jgi:ABC-type dipeptide/oligopeptide/nickel transport system permease component
MTLYILRRTAMLIPVLLGVTLLTFCIAKLTPGDPAVVMLGEHATPERVAELREQLGLNRPLLVQYGRYVWNVAHGDLGTSIRGKTPVLGEILARFPSTLQLTVAAMLIATVGGVVLGTPAALTRSKMVNGATMVAAFVGIAIPDFFLATLLIILFGIKLRWVQVAGGEGLRGLILPAFALAIANMAVIARLTRSNILEVIRQDHVRTARAKGLSDRAVIYRHVLRNAMIPVVTVIGLQFAGLLSGAVFIESVFARPGIGRFAVNAIAARDYPQVQGVVLFVAVIYVVLNLFVDVLYAVLDPRIRYS